METLFRAALQWMAIAQATSLSRYIAVHLLYNGWIRIKKWSWSLDQNSSRFLLAAVSDSLTKAFRFTFGRSNLAWYFHSFQLIGLFNWEPPKKEVFGICPIKTDNVYTLHFQFHSAPQPSHSPPKLWLLQWQITMMLVMIERNTINGRETSQNTFDRLHCSAIGKIEFYFTLITPPHPCNESEMLLVLHF